VRQTEDAKGNLLVFNNTIYDATDTTELGTNQGHCVRIVPGMIWNCHLTVQGKLFLGAPAFFVISGPLFDNQQSSPGTFTGTIFNQTFVGRSLLEPLPNQRFRFTLEWFY
jgi:hypothetical protein